MLKVKIIYLTGEIQFNNFNFLLLIIVIILKKLNSKSQKTI